MIESELKIIESNLGVKLPVFYTETMLNYPFSTESFAYEFTLCQDYKRLIEYNGVFESKDNSFAIGSDGGEFIFYIKLNGESKVYIFDLEGSDVHNSIESEAWEEYLGKLKKDEEETAKKLEEERQRKKNKKWWQFWI